MERKKTVPYSPPNPEHPAPFGAQEPRPAWPLTITIVLYAAWFGVLVWMALFYPAGR